MSELAARRARIVEEFDGTKIDAFVVSAPSNVRYLGGFTGSNALLVLTRGAATLFTDPRYTIRAAQESDCRVVIATGSLHAAAAKLLERERARRIGFERNRISFGAHAELEDKLPSGTRLIGVAGLVERHRMVKSDHEVELIRESVLLNSTAFERAVKRFKSSMSESDLAAELDYQMRRLGAEKAAFDTIVAAGANSALPHAQPGAARLGYEATTPRLKHSSRLLILVDMGSFRQGYASDMTRMLHAGKPGGKTRELYSAVLEAQAAAVDAVRENVTGGAVDRRARQVLRARGFEKNFVHSTGHGLGLEIHEPPRLGRKDTTRLKAGMIVTIEPGAYVEDFGGVRIEDTVLVTPNGCEILTPTSKDLLVV